MNYQELNFLIKEMSKVTYPELINVEPDHNLGNMIYDSYAGSKSELTTILTYVYQFLTNGNIQEISMILSAISKQEMTHFELLGQILVCLNMEPYFMNSHGQKWCSDNVKVEFKCIDEMFDYNIESEIGAISEYRNIIKHCSNKSIIAMLNRIILDEENHIELFKMLKRKYGRLEK